MEAAGSGQAERAASECEDNTPAWNTFTHAVYFVKRRFWQDRIPGKIYILPLLRFQMKLCQDVENIMQSLILSQGFNPYAKGQEVPNFPATPTVRPPVKGPPPCVWAVAQCCSSNPKRLVPCFEATGCPGIHWDPNPCRISIILAAREELEKFYAEAEEDRDS